MSKNESAKTRRRPIGGMFQCPRTTHDCRRMPSGMVPVQIRDGQARICRAKTLADWFFVQFAGFWIRLLSTHKTNRGSVVCVRVNPFRDCTVYYEPHSIDRSEQRSISSLDIDKIIREGRPARERDNIYKIRLGEWMVIVRLYRCNVVVDTAYRS